MCPAVSRSRVQPWWRWWHLGQLGSQTGCDLEIRSRGGVGRGAEGATWPGGVRCRCQERMPHFGLGWVLEGQRSLCRKGRVSGCPSGCAELGGWEAGRVLMHPCTGLVSSSSPHPSPCLLVCTLQRAQARSTKDSREQVRWPAGPSGGEAWPSRCLRGVSEARAAASQLQEGLERLRTAARAWREHFGPVPAVRGRESRRDC